MRIDIPAARQAAETRALTAALAIAAGADWQPRPVGAALSTPYRGYRHVEASQLLLATTSAGLPFAVRLAAGAMREARSDALVVACAADPLARPTPSFALGRWSPAGLRWMSPAHPFLTGEGALWLMPPRCDVGGRAVPLVSGLLRSARAPWTSLAEREAGRARALGWLDRVIGWTERDRP